MTKVIPPHLPTNEKMCPPKCWITFGLNMQPYVPTHYIPKGTKA